MLRVATIEGTQAVGLGDEVGSLEAGKQADLILIDLTVPNLIYAGSGNEVKTVVVAGRILTRVRASSNNMGRSGWPGGQKHRLHNNT